MNAVDVAVLEDEAILRDALAEHLTQRGLRVPIRSGRASEFLDALRRAPTRVALIDLRKETGAGATAGGPGLMVVRELREWLPQTRSIVLTDGPTPEEEEAAFAAGAGAYLDRRTTKLSELVPTVQRVASGETLRPVPVSFFEAAASPPPPRRNELDLLTEREREVLRHICTGADNLKIAAQLQITERTVRAHVSSLYRKLAAENRTELAILGRTHGLLPAMTQ